ncbi:major facilitator superfamily domain-containing protein [Mycena albidolilacea]|uniref:Major facilitator superfamily domain-containing protein n=1 Tax=Mycena albidolilacea TaxID=1033008 RepID=A0AAD7EL29_9AGAR|nr:major facilitator superfamily domain-containing protein [Mycena albidolilacea]
MASSSSTQGTGAASEQNANFVSTPTDPPPSVHSELDPATEDEEARQARAEMPFLKRPAPWWLMVLVPFGTTVLTSTVGAEVELQTNLVCRIHPPESQPDTYSVLPSTLPNFSSWLNATDSPQTFAAPNPCSSDPGVLAALAKFTTVSIIITGVLTLASVGWWGSFSDRHGRSRTMGILVAGQVLSPLIVIFVAKYADVLPGGYWFLLVEAIIKGVIGGTASEFAAGFAYLSDITPPEQRSATFSVVTGSVLAGFGVGPILGSVVVRQTHNLLSVFYLSAALRIIRAAWFWFLPESLTAAKMQRFWVKHKESTSSLFQRLFFFLEPLSVLLPEKISNPNSPKVGRRDWNLTFLALSYGAILLAASSLIDQFFYALHTFQWDAEYVGYCVSSIGISRAIFLILVLPVVIKYAKNRRSKPPSAHPGPSSDSERTPLLSQSDHAEPAPGSPKPKPTPPAPAVDLALARFSLLVDIAMYALLPFAPTGALFILFIALGSFGAGLAPAVNSVALELYTRKVAGKGGAVESGKLLGALNVVQAVFASVLGPLMYGSIYAATVHTHPRTIFFVALGNAVVAFLLLAFVRVAPEGDSGEEDV